MERFAKAMMRFDLVILEATLFFRGFCEKWLNCKRIWMERAFVVLYTISSAVVDVASLASHDKAMRWMLWMFPLQVVTAVGYWKRSTASNSKRVIWLWSEMKQRVLSMVMSIVSTPIWMTIPYRVLRWSVILSFLFTLATMFAVTIPYGGDDERGKKVKMALDKVVELFGTSWIQTPIPQPQ